MPFPTSLPRRSATRHALQATALAATVLLAACASPGPSHTPLAQTPADALGLQPAAHTPAAPAQWWSVLGDPQLDALVDQALQGNPSLAVSRARLEQAVALSQVREAANGPQATLGADVTRQRYTAHGLVPAPVAGNTYNSGNLQASLSWAPDFFGQHAAELQAALGQARPPRPMRLRPPTCWPPRWGAAMWPWPGWWRSATWPCGPWRSVRSSSS